jgi:hypothetical protein
MYSNIDWSRLEDQLQSMEGVRTTVRAESSNKTLASGWWHTWGVSGPFDFESDDSWSSTPLHDPACHILGS